MGNKFYFKMDGDLVLDVITYPHEGYVEKEIPNELLPLPEGIINGYIRLTEAGFIEDAGLKKITIEQDKNARRLISQDIIQEAIDAYTLELMEGGLL